jgi:uncharacterized protein YndB with AHSA1/START domain
MLFAPIAKAGMLIRKPISEVFEAVVNPDITTRFWFSKSTGRLEPGKQIRWEWESYDVAAQVRVRELERNRRLIMEWSAFGAPTRVEWRFSSRGDNKTFVEVTNTGFGGEEDEIARQAIDSTEGFTLVLAGLKAFLEHGIELNLVIDRFPDGPSGNGRKH